MYGFLRVNNCQLNQEQKQRYKKIYCGQCAALQKTFGYKWRTLVSYDATFFGLLVSAQQQQQAQEDKVWCAVFPKKTPIYSVEEVSQQFSAALAMLILSLKVGDSLQEKPSRFKTFAARYCQPQFEKAEAILTSLQFSTNTFSATLRQQEVIETQKRQQIEYYAEPSARLFAELFGFTATLTNTPTNQALLYDIGYHVGKTIYLVDSCVDIFNDIEQEQFNAFLAAYQENNGVIAEHSHSEIVKMVIHSLNTIRDLLDQVMFIRHHDLIANTLRYGFPQYLHRKILQSSRKIENNALMPLKYLPHAALASALCLFMPQYAEAGWKWGEKVISQYAGTSLDDTFTAYGYVCCEEKNCPCEKCDTLLNPCVCKIYERSTGGCCAFQVPKALLDLAIVGVGACALGDFFKSQQKQEAERTRKEQEAKNREAERIRQEEEAKRREQQQRQQAEEHRKRAIEEDKKYTKIINCPTCQGRGEACLRELKMTHDDGTEPNLWRELPDSQNVQIGDYDDSIWEGGRTSLKILRDRCPDCNGEGTAYAWNEIMPAHQQTCQRCQGKGKVTVKVKLDVGMGEKQATCEECIGTGKISIPEKEIMHVKTRYRVNDYHNIYRIPSNQYGYSFPISFVE